MSDKEKLLRATLEIIYHSRGYSVCNKTWQNGSSSKKPLYARHKSGKKIFIEILEKPNNKKEKEINEFYKDENYKIYYLNESSNELNSLLKIVKNK